MFTIFSLDDSKTIENNLQHSIYLNAFKNLMEVFFKDEDEQKDLHQNSSNYRHLAKLCTQNQLSLGDTFSRLEMLDKQNKSEVQTPKNMQHSRYDHSLDLNLVPDIDLLADKILHFTFDERDKYIDNLEINYTSSKYKEYSELLHYINSWLTGIINQLYLEYCANNFKTPNGRISVPEHFVHQVFLGENFDRIVGDICYFVNSYVDDDGRVFNNCYVKYIQSAIAKVEAHKGPDGKIKKFSDLAPIHNQNLDIKIVKKSPKLKKFLSHAERSAEITKALCEVWIHPIYSSKIKGELEINNSLCDKMRTFGFYDRDKNRSYLHVLSMADTGVHEVIHEAVENDDDLSFITLNFIYERGKGQKFKKLSELDPDILDDAYFKPGIDALRPTAGILEFNYELYYENNELFSELVGTYLMGGEKVIPHLLGNVPVNTAVEKIVAAMREKLDELYEKDPELALLFLSFLDGDI